MPNVVLTPHIGGATWNTEARQAQMVADDLEALLSGDTPAHHRQPGGAGLGDVSEIKSSTTRRTAVLAAAKDMLRRGLVEGTAGNISARREDGNMVITPVVGRLRGHGARRPGAGRPRRRGAARPRTAGSRRRRCSCTWPATRRSTTSAASSTAIRCGRPCSPSPISRFRPASTSSRSTAAATFGAPSTRRPAHPMSATNAVKALEGRGAALIANHGLVAVGPRPDKVLHITALVERTAQIVWGARALGGPVPDSRGGEPELRRRLRLSAHQPHVMERVRLGRASVTRVVEFQFELGTRFSPERRRRAGGTMPTCWCRTSSIPTPISGASRCRAGSSRSTASPSSWTPASATTANVRRCRRWIT